MSVVNLTSLILVAFCFKCIQTSSISPIVLRESTRKCTELGKSPYFDIDIVVGEPWRIYYTWDIHMEAKCLDFIFKNATQPITKRFFTDMYDYLETQPTWDAATMYMSMGAGNQHEILLFASQGAAGTFDGVPNVMKRPSAIAPNREGVPILKFFIKILDGGKYLLMIDCIIGVASLASRERSPNRLEVATIASSLNLGDGTPACITEVKKNRKDIF